MGELGAPPLDGPAAGGAGGDAIGEAGNDGGAPGGPPTAATGGSAGEGGATADGGAAPAQHAPCESGSCWEAPSPTPHCGTVAGDEDFATGKYNVHAYPILAPAAVPLELTLQQTAGAWSPAVLLADGDGTIVHDGSIAASSVALQIEVLATGEGASSAAVRITAAEDTPLRLFVTAWDVVASDFTGPMPADASYTLSARLDCPPGSATCPMDPGSITTFGSGYFTSADSSDPNAPNFSPYKRDSRDSHSGYDLHAPLGTPVLATQSGTIVAASTTDTGLCGRSVNLAADSGVTFRYCHLEKVLVTSGTVQAGQVIGLNGQTGNAKSPHVHFAYLDAPNVTGTGTEAQKSEKVNAYIDGLCK